MPVVNPKPSHGPRGHFHRPDVRLAKHQLTGFRADADQKAVPAAHRQHMPPFTIKHRLPMSFFDHVARRADSKLRTRSAVFSSQATGAISPFS
jgi:hypothetical protein